MFCSLASRIDEGQTPTSISSTSKAGIFSSFVCMTQIPELCRSRTHEKRQLSFSIFLYEFKEQIQRTLMVFATYTILEVIPIYFLRFVPKGYSEKHIRPARSRFSKTESLPYPFMESVERRFRYVGNFGFVHRRHITQVEAMQRIEGLAEIHPWPPLDKCELPVVVIGRLQFQCS